MARNLNKVIITKVLAHIGQDEIEQKDMTGESNGFAVHDLAEQLPFVSPGKANMAIKALRVKGYLKDIHSGIVQITPKGWAKLESF